MFEAYDRYLQNEWNIDYWYDLGLGQAAGMLEEFRDGDWLNLLQALASRQEEWRHRCAETLGDVESTPVFSVLEKLMETSAHDQLMAVFASVMAHAQAGRKMNVTGSFQGGLARARQHASSLDQLVLNRLDALLGSSER